jgi:hypothetical protein
VLAFALLLISLELKGEERLKALEDLLQQEKTSCSAKTNEGFKAVKVPIDDVNSPKSINM